MSGTINVLIIEDLPTDAELCMREIRKSLGSCKFQREETREQYLAALESFKPDVIISDFKLPHFDGLSALKLAQERAPDTPFIIVTGSMNEDTAVECMKAGAWDYVIKEHIKRLGPAVLGALEQKKVREENQRAREALRESEERYEALYGRSFECVYIHDFNGNFIDANPAALALLGYNEKEIQSLNFASLLTEDQLPLVFKTLEELRNTGTQKHISEYRLRQKNDTVIDVETKASAIHRKGKPYAVQGIARDITERKKTEQALKRAKDYAENIIRYANLLIVMLDLKGNVISLNETGERTIGYKQNDILGKNWFELIVPKEKYPQAWKEFEGFQKSGAINEDIENPLLTKSGEERILAWKNSVLSIGGKAFGILSFGLDISERKRAEEARRQAEENFRRSMDESPLGIRIVSVKGETLYANRAILDLYGFDDLEEFKSTPVKNRYTPQSYDEYQIRKKKRMNGKDSPSEYEISIIRKAGEIRHLQVFKKDILWNGQKQFQAIYQDITERKKAEKRAVESFVGLRRAFLGIIQALSLTIEKRDPYTFGHQQRVADLAEAIGQELGFTMERLESLCMAALIHDIGKVSVPFEILSKPTRLTEGEYTMIKSHPQVAYDIIQNIDFPWPIAKWILQHHERMNGSGYPNQLKGEEILLEARILAVSDVVEAMASHRPYRPALGIEKALEEIDQNKAILYDPAVVNACLRLFRETRFAWADRATT